MISLPNNWSPRAYQVPLWGYLEHGGREAVAVWHRRAGKDEVGLHRACCAAHERPANYWHMLPEASQARKAIWDAVNPKTGKRRIDEAFPLELRESTREQEMLIKFKVGATWQVVGSDNFNSLVGSSPAGIVYSEWALAKPSARAFLRPIIADNNGWELFIYTPRGRNHGMTTLESARKTPGSFAQVLTAHDTGAISSEILDREQKGYINEYGREAGEAYFRQEYFCDFNAAVLGSILAKQVDRAEREGRISENVSYDPEGAPIEISADIGMRDTAAWWFWQPKLGSFALVDYVEGNGMNASEWCEKLGGIINAKSYTLGKIWLPHDARHKQFAAQHSAQEQFWNHFGIQKIEIVPATSKADRINAARVVIEKCEFNETNCADGIEALRAWMFEWDEDRKEFSTEPRHDWACFHPDTEVLTRYGIRRIMDLPQNGEVLTPCGWKAYEGPKITRRNAQLVEVAFKDGHTAKCTPDHLFLTDSGWKSAESLMPGSLIQSSLTRSRSISMAAFTAYGLAKNISLAVAKKYIGWFGQAPLALFPMDVTYTTATATQPTTCFQILNVKIPKNTWEATQILPIINLRQMHGNAQKIGINQRPDCFGIGGKARISRGGLNGHGWTSRVLNVAKSLRRSIVAALQRKNSAPTFAASRTIESVSPLNERADTCCIHVPDGQWFSLANGAVVHNSHPSDGFSYGAQIMRHRTIAEMPQQPKYALDRTFNQLVEQLTRKRLAAED